MHLSTQETISPRAFIWIVIISIIVTLLLRW
jgi:hypothetical protein